MIVLKPLLLVFDYADILVINGILQTLLTSLIILGLYKRRKKYVILPFMVTVLSIMPMTIALCLQFSDVYYITLIGAALIVWGHGRIGNERMYILFLILGMATSYFDFLTYPFVSLGIPIAMFLVCLDKEKVKKQIFYLIQCSFLWCIGYGGMWAGKWILGSVLMPEAGSWSQALSSIIYRGGNKAEEMTLTLYDVLLRNMFIYLKWPIMILIGVLAACFVYLIISKKRFDKKALLYAIPYIIVCFYPLAWYLITRNHSYEHAFMAYRELSIATFAGLCMLARTGYGCIR